MMLPKHGQERTSAPLSHVRVLFLALLIVFSPFEFLLRCLLFLNNLFDCVHLCFTFCKQLLHRIEIAFTKRLVASNSKLLFSRFLFFATLSYLRPKLSDFSFFLCLIRGIL